MDKTVTSLTEYIDSVKKIVNLQMPQKGQITKLLFRGQPNKAFALLPSIARNRKDEQSISILDFERYYVDTAKSLYPSIFHENLSPIALLGLLQHHGFPTRLLDVSTNPLVALYFACDNKGDLEDKDGEVFVFNQIWHRSFDYAFLQGIAETYRFADYTYVDLDRFCNQIKMRAYACELADFDVPLSSMLQSILKSILFTEAQYITERQKIQQGNFILFPNRIIKNNNKEVFSQVIDEINKNDSRIYCRIAIPSENKAEILSDLALFGISKSTLFSDNIDSVFEQIRDSLNQRVKE